MCQSCRTKDDRFYGKRSRQKNRDNVISAYGGKCSCCGESNIEFLAMDHINKDGNVHRKSVPTSRIYRWLEVHGYPSGFRILCHNCNMSLGLYGYCPHNKEQ